MFLKSLRVLNFRSIRDAEVSFENEDGAQRKWTILVGENGVGKSNLLRAIALATAGSKALPQLVGPDPSNLIQSGKRACRISLTLETLSGDVRDIELRINRGDTPNQVVKKNLVSLDAIDRAIRHTARNYFVVGYGSSRRLAPSGAKVTRSANTPFRVLRVRSLFDPEATLNPLDTWAARLQRKSRRDMNSVLKCLDEFLHGISIKGVSLKQGRLLFRTPYGAVPLRQLGHGYRDVAAWVGDLLYQVTMAFGNYSSPLSARGVLLIDEIGLHLHPQWQRRLCQFLSEQLPNFQLIVTTYSPMIAQQAGPNEVHLVHADDNNRVRIDAFEADPRKMLLHQIVMSDLFGIESDESAGAQQLKSDYRKLARKKRKTAKDKTRLSELKQKILELPEVRRSNVKLPKQIKQLNAIFDKLKGLGG